MKVGSLMNALRFLIMSLGIFIVALSHASSQENCINVSGQYSKSTDSFEGKNYFILEQSDCLQIINRDLVTGEVTTIFMDQQLRKEWETKETSFYSSYSWNENKDAIVFHFVYHDRNFGTNYTHDGELRLAENGNLIMNIMRIISPNGKKIKGDISIWDRIRSDS